MSKSGDYRVDVQIPSILGSEEVVLKTLREVAEKMDFSQLQADRLRTAVSEACINAIEHGNGCVPEKRVLVSIYNRDPELVVEVGDEGEGLSERPPKPDITRKATGEEPARGWGVFLMEKFVGKVEFESSQTGSLVRLTATRGEEA